MIKVLMAVSAIFFIAQCTSVEKVPGPIPRTLVIGIDGLSYQTFQKMQAGGYFRNFQEPSPMIATFPSISDPNWSQIMNTGPERCFTKACFDPEIKTTSGVGSENGGLMTHLSRHPRYEELVDFRAEGIWEHISMFIWTETTALFWLESLEKEFFAFRGRETYFALFINPDLLSHTEGEEKMQRYLAAINDRVEKIQARYKEKYAVALEVVLVSDHGNYFTAPIDIPLEQDLGKLGWNLAPTLTGAKDVGFYVPEILSFGAFYCLPKSERDLAAALSKVSHVHLSAYSISEFDIRIFSGKGEGEAKIIVNQTSGLIDYQIVKGKDPLGQSGLFKKGPISLDQYFLKTAESDYPNALFRIWEGFYKNSNARPSVLVDPELGWVFGNKALRLITDIRGLKSSHGSLRKEESLGVVASTHRTFGPIRPQDFRNFVNVKQLQPTQMAFEN